MSIILETARLFIRELTLADAPQFIRLNADPLVVKYTGDTSFSSLEEAEQVIRTVREQYAVYGYGRWAVTLKENQEFIGWCGLKYHPNTMQTEIGFRFFQHCWNKGFATEAASACIYHGFQHLQLSHIYAHAMRENKASIKVIEKCGLKLIPGIASHCQDGLVFCLANTKLS